MIGRHLILEHWGGNLDPETLAEAMEAAAVAAGATVLSRHFHPFEGGGVTGVLMLAESHVTVHTWPEHGYAALDLFMCGDAPVEAAADHLDAALAPARTSRQIVPRGVPA
ncbi:adenosylmethionine decarboxylase [Jannaschia pohangensis]|uniref:S-adenosylmethionine decarboxylase n=1 Tax=Jannaschia pohangensis TaxID=390807 RepID=A0A1I3RY25_9RHOB|nr:adenosylmethionine decarboxylase [Jannaschia pohangensis]SFJ51325.1 S-adenosylmethionine decarboxylase [Jannaschia pohangensis]